MTTSWAELTDHFLSGLRARGYKPATVKGYAFWLRGLASFGESHGLRPVDVTLETMAAFRHQVETIYSKPETRMQVLGVVRSFWRWAVAEQAVLLNPTQGWVLPRVKRDERVCPSEADLEQVLAMPDVDTPQGLRDSTLLEVLYGVGVRLSECAGLDVDDVDLAQATLYVRHPKGPVARALPLAPHLAARLDLWLRRGRPAYHRRRRESALFLNRFGVRLSTTRIEQVVSSTGRQAGLPGLTPHLLRHAFGSHLLANGADIATVKMLLGHESLSSTRTYAHLLPTQLAEHLAQMHPRFRQPPPTPTAAEQD